MEDAERKYCGAVLLHVEGVHMTDMTGDMAIYQTACGKKFAVLHDKVVTWGLVARLHMHLFDKLEERDGYVLVTFDEKRMSLFSKDLHESGAVFDAEPIVFPDSGGKGGGAVHEMIMINQHAITVVNGSPSRMVVYKRTDHQKIIFRDPDGNTYNDVYRYMDLPCEHVGVQFEGRGPWYIYALTYTDRPVRLKSLGKYFSACKTICPDFLDNSVHIIKCGDKETPRQFFIQSHAITPFV